MKMEYLAGIAISYCLDYLKKRPIGTTYHPDIDQFILDGKTAARILKYEGNLQASVNPSEIRFFTIMLKSIYNETSTFKSIFSDEKYFLTINTNFNRYAIEFEKTHFMRSLKGRKPGIDFEKDEMEEKRNVSMEHVKIDRTPVGISE
jgi:hypothetical protein